MQHNNTHLETHLSVCCSWACCHTQSSYRLNFLDFFFPGDKGDACVQCDGLGPPGLPGPVGPKGERGKRTAATFSNVGRHFSLVSKLNCCVNNILFSDLKVPHMFPVYLHSQQCITNDLHCLSDRTTWACRQQRRKGSVWCSWTTWKACELNILFKTCKNSILYYIYTIFKKNKEVSECVADFLLCRVLQVFLG